MRDAASSPARLSRVAAWIRDGFIRVSARDAFTRRFLDARSGVVERHVDTEALLARALVGDVHHVRRHCRRRLRHLQGHLQLEAPSSPSFTSATTATAGAASAVRSKVTVAEPSSCCSNRTASSASSGAAASVSAAAAGETCTSNRPSSPS